MRPDELEVRPPAKMRSALIPPEAALSVLKEQLEPTGLHSRGLLEVPPLVLLPEPQRLLADSPRPEARPLVFLREEA